MAHFTYDQKETGMRPGLRVFLGAALGIVLFFSAGIVMADEVTQAIASKVLATFDDSATAASNWIVQGSKYATQDYPQMKIVPAWPEALYGRNKDNKPLFALGVHGKFDRKSYNYIEIIPAAKDSNGKLVPKSIPIPGRAKSIDMWVWGSNYNYWLDIHLRDFQGVDHVVHMGSLLFAGWKDLTATVSGAIPQARQYIPKYAGLELTKLVLWTAPDEKVDDFYFFVDEITCITDLFESRFDGSDLADPDQLNSLWQSGK